MSKNCKFFLNLIISQWCGSFFYCTALSLHKNCTISNIKNSFLSCFRNHVLNIYIYVYIYIYIYIYI